MKTIIAILKKRGFKTAADLLRNSYYKINASSSYGSAWHSLISTAEIFSPVDANEKLLSLPEKLNKAILSAFMTVYPARDNSEEVHYIEFSIDDNLDPIFQKVTPKKLLDLNIEFVSEQIEKCNEKLSNEDFNGAITNARSLLEAISIFIIESENETVQSPGDLPKLYKQAAKLINMDPEKHVEKSLKEILQGCASIVSGVSSLRNNRSDAHATSLKKNFRPAKRHAELVINVAYSLSEYMVNSYQKK